MSLRTIENLGEAAASGTPVQIVDPGTRTAFVLLSAQQYEKIRTLLGDDDFDIADAYPLMNEVARNEGWDDPEMDIYDRLREPHQ